MPWTVADVDKHKAGLSARQKRVWVRVANSALRACLARDGAQSTCEASAIRQANATAGRVSPTANTRHVLTMATLAVQTGFEVRYEVLEDKTYLVAPVVPIIEGVLNEYFIPREEIAAFVQAWEGIPVPVDHPKSEYGDFVSANTPEVLEQCVGRFFHPRMDGARLIGEVWIDIEKCERLGGISLECLQRIERGEHLECSTAFWADTRMEQGLFNNTRYIGIHSALRPDHLALLPHDVGACSVSDGCGIRACVCVGPCHCQEGALMDLEADKPGKLRSALRTLFAFANGADEDALISDSPQKEAEHGAKEEGPEADAEAQALSTHLTHDDIRAALCAALAEAYKQAHPGQEMYYYPDMVVDIEEDQVIYREGQTLYRRAYAVGDNSAIALMGEAETVQRVTTYVPVGAMPDEPVVETAGGTPRQKGARMKTKAELVQELIAHEQTTWKEEQKSVLEVLEERVLEQMIQEANERGQEVPLTPKKFEEMLTQALDKHSKAFEEKLATYSQQAEERAEREHLVGYLVTQHGWPEEEASALPLTALRRFQRSIDPVSYIGQGMPRFPMGNPDENLPADSPKWD